MIAWLFLFFIIIFWCCYFYSDSHMLIIPTSRNFHQLYWISYENWMNVNTMHTLNRSCKENTSWYCNKSYILVLIHFFFSKMTTAKISSKNSSVWKKKHVSILSEKHANDIRDKRYKHQIAHNNIVQIYHCIWQRISNSGILWLVFF